MLIRPAQRGAIQTALLTDDLLQAGHAGQIHPRFPDALSAIEQSGRRIKPSAYVGISGKIRLSCQRTR
jgi:hypothetical protein